MPEHSHTHTLPIYTVNCRQCLAILAYTKIFSNYSFIFQEQLKLASCTRKLLGILNAIFICQYLLLGLRKREVEGFKQNAQQYTQDTQACV